MSECSVKRVEREINGKILSIETGKLAKQAHGSALVRYGDTVVLAAVVSSPKELTDVTFFPLTVDYREKTAAAGKFPGGFIKREGRPTTKEVLTMRMIDRPIRPSFPKGYFDEVQIMSMVLSSDRENDSDILALIASSAALSVSPIPFKGPIGAVRVAKVKDEFVINPTHSELEFSEMDLVLAGRMKAVNMIELGSQPCSEETVAEAIVVGHGVIKEVCAMIDELVDQVKPVKQEDPQFPPEYDTILNGLKENFASAMRDAKQIVAKQERNQAMKDIKEQAAEKYIPADSDNKDLLTVLMKLAFEEFEEEISREMILNGKRADGREYDQLREITCDVGLLPRTHGSAVFTRGETQAIVTVTLGTTENEQVVDGLSEEYSKKFMLDYNFPPFSVGETRPIRGPGRREFGHGALAERALASVMPEVEKFPYTVRIVSDILESNGSSSMATVCGGTLALMDAGVPITSPVAGISIGMVSDAEKKVYLTDIIGDEDHFGDMDFKVAGTRDGITAIQLDLKMDGIDIESIKETFQRAKKTRLQILDKIAETLPEPRSEISEHAPCLLTIKIDPSKIGKIIGPGGKQIRKLQEETGANIEIEDDGTVYLSSVGQEGGLKARAEIEKLTEEVKIGKIYDGTVVSIKDFGAFVEVLPGAEGLCHISELSNGYVKSVSDICQIGDSVRVKVLDIDNAGKIRLSIRAAEDDDASNSSQ